jgi:hypothetical protein
VQGASLLLLPQSSQTISSCFKSKKKTKFLTSPSSAIKFQQRLQCVQNYLVDQHLSSNDTVKRQLFVDEKSTKRRKTSTCAPLTSVHDPSTDRFQSKLTTLVSLVHECVSLTSSALTRARSQASHEQRWQQLQTIEQEIGLFVNKLDVPSAYNNPSANIEKGFQNLAQLINDWQKHEEEFNQQLLFNTDQ